MGSNFFPAEVAFKYLLLPHDRFSRWQTDIFCIFFQKKRFWHDMQIVS